MLRRLGIVLALVLLTQSAAEAQRISRYATRGTVELEGGFNVTYVSLYDQTSFTMFDLRPAVRYFVTQGLSIGGTLGYRYISFDSPDGGYHSSAFVFLPGVEYNFFTHSRVFPYVAGSFGLEHRGDYHDLSLAPTYLAHTLLISGGTDPLLEFGGGIKIELGGGLLGFGVAVPILFADGATFVAVSFGTRYAVFF